VTTDVADMRAIELRKEVVSLRSKIRRLRAIARSAFARIKATNVQLTNKRIPDGASKQELMDSIERAREGLPLRMVLRIVGLSSSRYHGWKRQQECALDDGPSCPRHLPQQLTPEEVATIKEMVTSEEYRHVATGTLAHLAQRLGKVYASASTWCRLIRVHGLRRPRNRIHPRTPKVGIRAKCANEIWHIDMTVIRLLDGSHVYLHAVLDNYSRRVLAWKLTETFSPSSTVEVLLVAAKELEEETPTLLVDGGVENFNQSVDELIGGGMLKRVLARTDIASSNSLIEAWWRTLKHQWLFLNTLGTQSAVETHIAFYVDEHNTKLPHSAFRGQTPDEMYFGTGKEIPD
jgi:putative transposase